MICELAFWFPIKVTRCLFHPVISMFEDLNRIASDMADDVAEAVKAYEAEHGF